MIEEFSNQTHDIETLKQIEKILSLLSSLQIKLKFWKSQNLYFSISKENYPEELKNAENGDENSQAWINSFNNIGELLKMDLR